MGLTRVTAVARAMGLKIGSDKPYKAILVGGTNGKGSTCAMLEQIYAEAGYKVGKYASPHLLRYNERVRLNLHEVSDEMLCAAFVKVQTSCQSTATALTYFEFGTLCMFAIFEQEAVDVAVIEVGLGGRLDATNIIDADVAAVVTVDIDHQSFLGNTRELIGYEKAGIYRNGKVALIGDANPPQSLVEHARNIGARFERIGHEFGVVKTPETQQQWQFWHVINGDRKLKSSLPHPALRGPYQLSNAAVALAAVDALNDALPVAANEVKRGLLHVELLGRFQVLPGRPAVVLDVAHNPHAAAVFADSLLTMGFFQTTYAVFAMMRDKEVGAVIDKLLNRMDHWLLPAIAMERALPPEQMRDILVKHGVAENCIQIFISVDAAVAHAKAHAGTNDRIACFGTFPLVASALSVLK